jgi:hypothetical protein
MMRYSDTGRVGLRYCSRSSTGGTGVFAERGVVVKYLLVVAVLALTACSSAASDSSPAAPSSGPNPVAQANTNTCNAFGQFLQGIATNTANDVSVVDTATGTNGVTYQDTPASPALQALVNKWDDQVQNFYANNQSNETTGAAVEKTDRLVTEYGNQIEAWCAANAGVNLAGDGSTNPKVWATEGP